MNSAHYYFITGICMQYMFSEICECCLSGILCAHIFVFCFVFSEYWGCAWCVYGTAGSPFMQGCSYGGSSRPAGQLPLRWRGLRYSISHVNFS